MTLQTVSPVVQLVAEVELSIAQDLSLGEQSGDEMFLFHEMLLQAVTNSSRFVRMDSVHCRLALRTQTII